MIHLKITHKEITNNRLYKRLNLTGLRRNQSLCRISLLCFWKRPGDSTSGSRSTWKGGGRVYAVQWGRERSGLTLPQNVLHLRPKRSPVVHRPTVPDRYIPSIDGYPIWNWLSFTLGTSLTRLSKIKERGKISKETSCQEETSGKSFQGIKVL